MIEMDLRPVGALCPVAREQKVALRLQTQQIDIARYILVSGSGGRRDVHADGLRNILHPAHRHAGIIASFRIRTQFAIRRHDIVQHKIKPQGALSCGAVVAALYWVSSALAVAANKGDNAPSRAVKYRTSLGMLGSRRHDTLFRFRSLCEFWSGAQYKPLPGHLPNHGAFRYVKEYGPTPTAPMAKADAHGQ